MLNKKKYYIAAIVITAALITFLHLAIFQEQLPYIVLGELYYIPLLFGAMVFGLKGAILTYLFVSLIPAFLFWKLDCVVFGFSGQAILAKR